MSDAASLRGAGVLVTRPAHQADRLCRLIEAHGGRAVRFPAVEIQEPRELESARSLLAAANGFDLLVFVSANAVERAADHLPSPLRAWMAAVGEATARALRRHGLEPSILPVGSADSEGLLAAPGLADVTGKRVLIVRGEGGRPLLGDALAARGAEVRYAEVYRRALPAADPAALLAGWRETVHVVTVSSRELLDNLLVLLGDAGRARLLATPLVVISDRLAAAARTAGFTRVAVAASALDEAVLEGILRALADAR
ncbi:MAG: uroporphyrinogen-III synthase [Thermoanaerobaculales bacterium]|jgi:uroporphyrinogen-III synthase|nr:uroporphyrinogen-III synthase [Thermoanaerobaculales bacterium]